MNHTLEIQITTETGATAGLSNPAESYAAKILEDAKAGFQKYRWDMIPNEKQPSAPTFLIIDDPNSQTANLTDAQYRSSIHIYRMYSSRLVLYLVAVAAPVRNRQSAALRG